MLLLLIKGLVKTLEQNITHFFGVDAVCVNKMEISMECKGIRSAAVFPD